MPQNPRSAGRGSDHQVRSNYQRSNDEKYFEPMKKALLSIAQETKAKHPWYIKIAKLLFRFDIFCSFKADVKLSELTTDKIKNFKQLMLAMNNYNKKQGFIKGIAYQEVKKLGKKYSNLCKHTETSPTRGVNVGHNQEPTRPSKPIKDKLSTPSQTQRGQGSIAVTDNVSSRPLKKTSEIDNKQVSSSGEALSFLPKMENIFNITDRGCNVGFYRETINRLQAEFETVSNDLNLQESELEQMKKKGAESEDISSLEKSISTNEKKMTDLTNKMFRYELLCIDIRALENRTRDVSTHYEVKNKISAEDICSSPDFTDASEFAQKHCKLTKEELDDQKYQDNIEKIRKVYAISSAYISEHLKRSRSLKLDPKNEKIMDFRRNAEMILNSLFFSAKIDVKAKTPTPEFNHNTRRPEVVDAKKDIYDNWVESGHYQEAMEASQSEKSEIVKLEMNQEQIKKLLNSKIAKPVAVESMEPFSRCSDGYETNPDNLLFANKMVGGGTPSGGAVQEENKGLQHPMFVSVVCDSAKRSSKEKGRDDEALRLGDNQVTVFRHMGCITLEEPLNKREHVVALSKNVRGQTDSVTTTNLLCVDAPDKQDRKNRGRNRASPMLVFDYNIGELKSFAAKLYTGAMAMQFGKDTEKELMNPLKTGRIGCGDYANSRFYMFVLQDMMYRKAGVKAEYAGMSEQDQQIQELAFRTVQLFHEKGYTVNKVIDFLVENQKMLWKDIDVGEYQNLAKNQPKDYMEKLRQNLDTALRAEGEQLMGKTYRQPG